MYLLLYISAQLSMKARACRYRCDWNKEPNIATGQKSEQSLWIYFNKANFDYIRIHWFFFFFCSSYSLGSFLTLQRLPGQTKVSTKLQRNIMILYARQKRASLHLKIIQSASCNHQTGTTIEIKTWKGAIQQIIFIALEDVYSCWEIRFKHLW